MIDVKATKDEIRMHVCGSTAEILCEISIIIRKTQEAISKTDPELGEMFKQILQDPSFMKEAVFGDHEEGGTLRWTMKL